jgi:hypothetical protein
MTVVWIAGCGEQFAEPEMKRNITMCGTDRFMRQILRANTLLLT